MKLRNVIAMFQVAPATNLLVTNLLLTTALVIFAIGFFPYKTYVPGKATFGDGGQSSHTAPAPFDKVIFMVVDALRR